MGAPEELIAAWRNNPSADATRAICERLAALPREDWVREVGTSAESWYANDARVMLAVGRMYLGASLLGEAQSAFVAASRADPRAPEPFRWLGEVLLRRGDAIRAERVLSRALELGGGASGTFELRERAQRLTVLQQRRGAQVVAAEVARELPTSAIAVGGGVVMDAKSRPSRPPIAPAAARERPLPRFDSDPAEVSEVYTVKNPSAKTPSPHGIGSGRNPSRGAAAPVRARVPAAPLRPEPPPRRAPEPSDEDVTEMVHMPSFDEIDGSLPSFDDIPTDIKRPAATPAPMARTPAPPFVATSRSARPQPAPVLDDVRSAPPPLVAKAASPAFADVAVSADAVEPQPAILLEHLARVGVFEPGGGAAPAWEAAPRQKARGVIPLVLGIVLVAGGGAGGYEYSRRVKTERIAQASALTNEVDKLLHSGNTNDLESTDQKLSRVFDLDSRSQRAARQWLENRVLGALLLKSEPRGIDSAVHRGRTAGLSESELAVGRVASFLVEGDLAGAAAVLPKFDAAAAKDAIYQMTAGAVLQRAGDPRAGERYAAARSLDPRLVPASMLLARLLLLEQGVEKARPVMDDIEKALGPDAPIVRALEALAWTVDPARSVEPPEKARLRPDDIAKLPAPLLGIPPMVDATQALAKGDLTNAAKALDAALLHSDGPALASSIGFVAIEAGDEQLARKAALKALSFAALYPRARTLAARVALLGGRLDEAQKAVEELDPKSADVAVVRGAVAYESGDSAELEASLALLGDARSAPSFAALAAGPGVLQGNRYLEPKKLEALAAPSIPWGEIVAADSALNTNNLTLAESVLGPRMKANAAPVHLLRIARLRRYQKRLDDALAATERALAERPSAPLAIERVLELVEKDKAPEAREFVARHQASLGPSAGWLSVVVDMAANQAKLAASRLTQLEPPPDEAPAYLRLVAARALVMGNDKRARGYVVQLVRRLGKHPDAIATAQLLNGQ
jgi:tetratricopeptide (TPR) repeat protein